MAQAADDWFQDEAFWSDTFPFMFPETRFVAAAEAVPKIATLTGMASGSVLDLACGPGRFAVPFAQAKYRVTGVDRTRFFLNIARERAEIAAVPVEWVEEDMRQFVRPGAFDLALSLYTSFGYFDLDAENRGVLENVYSSLRPGGVFLLELLGKEILAAQFQPTLSESLPDGSLLIQRVSVCDDWTRVAGEWTVIKEGRSVTYRNRLWIYSAREIRDMLTQAGFEEIAIYGDFERAPYGPQAKRLVGVARKTSN
jgi:SAM-dependent methyltransferase